MSLYIFNFTEDYAIVGADSRMCASVDNGNTYYRWHDNVQKIHVVDNKIITVGGVEWAGSLALIKFKESPNRSIERLRDIAKYITQSAEQIARSMGTKFVTQENNKYFLELCVMTYEDGKNVAYHIADYKDFEIVRVESRQGMLMNFFGGIHIDEAKVVYRKFVGSMDLVDVYKQMYEAVADEKCGGSLTLYEMKHGEIVKRHNYPIRDSRQVKDIPDNIKAQYGINIIGQEGKFGGIQVFNDGISEEEIKRDPSLYNDLVLAEIGTYRNNLGQITRGIKLNNGCFEITSRNVPGIINNGIIMNPTDGLIVTKSDNRVRSKFNATEGISIETSTNGIDWSKKLFADTSGKLNLVDIKASGEIVANSLAATTKITVGNINLLDLVNNGINTLTGVINGATIQANTISASHIKTNELIVGTNVQMGANATISWGNVTNQPFIPDSGYITQITNNTVNTTYVNALNVTSGRLTVKSGYTTLLDGFEDTNGGVLKIYDTSGLLDVKIGVESGISANKGGTLILYRDSPYDTAPNSIQYQRIEAGIINGSGIMNLRDNDAVVRISIVAEGSFPYIGVRDSSGIAKTYLTPTNGYINGSRILTEADIPSIVAKFA